MAAYSPEAERRKVRRVGIYVRISKDREGAGLGVERQEQDCRQLAEYKARSLEQVWEVHDVYVDNDVSASSRKRRPDYERMMADLRAGVITVAIAWHVDRLTRKPAEMETIIAESEKYGFELATVQGEIDLATPAGRLFARQLGSFARYEMEHKSEKQVRANLQAAEAGKPHTGGRRGYGYAPNRVDIVEEEAEVLRDMADKIIGGVGRKPMPVLTLCRDLNARGLTTTAGRQWTPAAVRRLLQAPRLIGKRVHQGRLYDAGWEPILTPDVQQRIVSILSDPSRRNGWDGSRGRRYLLSGGLLVCALCGHKLVSQPANGVRGYVCTKDNPPGGCGRIRICAGPLEEDVAERVLARCASPNIRRRLLAASQVDEGDYLTEKIAAAERKLKDLAHDWATDGIDKLSYDEARGKLNDLIMGWRSQISRAATLLHLPAVSTPAALAAWWYDQDTTVDRRHDLVKVMLDHAVISRITVWGSKTFDPDRVDYVWR